MKKALLAVSALVVVAALALIVFWPQVRLWQVQQALDKVLIPAIKAQYQAAYGREPLIAHQGLTAEGSAFVVKDFAMSLPGQPALEVKVKDFRLDKVDISLFGDLKTCDLALKEVAMEAKGLEVGAKTFDFSATLAEVQAQGLSISEGGTSIRLARKAVRDLKLTGTALPAPVQITSLEARDYQLKAGPDWKTSQGSLGLLTMSVENLVSVSLKDMTFSADTPTWQKGAAYFDRALIQTKGLTVSLPQAPEPVFSLAEMRMDLSRKPQRAADRVELKGIAWQQSADDKALQALKELGYDQPRLDVAYAYVYDQAAKTLDCPELTLALEQGGKLGLSFGLKDMEADVSGDAERTVQALKKARPTRLNLRYDDASLADKLLALAAQKQEQTPEALRAQLLAQVPTLPGAVGPEPALLAFISKPGSLCLNITPRQELSLEQYALLGPAIMAVLEWKLDNCAK